MSGLRTAAVVLGFNRPETCLACLRRINRTRPSPGCVILVDNGSEPEFADRIMSPDNPYADEDFPVLHGPFPDAAGLRRENPPRFILVKNPRNLGYAGGNNAGLRLALELGFDLAWLLNDDALPHENALGELQRRAKKNPEAGIIGPTLVDPVDPSRIVCAGGCAYNRLTTVIRPALAGMELSKADAADLPRLDYIHGASPLLRTAMLKQIGLLNEKYFLYYEELDLAARAKRAGYRLAWARTAVVRHKDGSGRDHEDSRTRQYHENLSTLVFTRENHPGLLVPAMLIRLAAKLVLLPLRGRAGLLGPVFRAYLDFLRRRRR